MRISHNSLALLLMTALCSCTSAQTSTVDETQHLDAASAGQRVADIDPRIWVIHQARNGEYWFGSNGSGVYRYDGQGLTRYTQADGLRCDQVRDIQEDAKGTVFVATHTGVSKFDGESFRPLELVDGPPDGEGWVLDPNDVWILFDPGDYGVLRYDGEKLYHLKLPKSSVHDAQAARHADAPGFFSPFSVYSIYRDRRGHLWFGTAGVGLCRFDGETLSWMYEEQLTTTPSGGAFGIRSIYEDRAGDFWICNTGHRFEMSPEVTGEDENNLIQYERKQGLPRAQLDTAESFNFYPSMTEDETGALWMACGSDGVLKYDGDEVTRHSLVEGAYAIDIHCDHEGKLWVGTINHGIYTLEGESFAQFKPHPSSN
jgi:ligand-binding sensor domain-containing protein